VVQDLEIERLEARVQVLEQEKASVEAFAAAAAHELLEPLILTESYAELVSQRLDETDHADSRRDLLLLGNNVRRVRLLVESLLLDAASATRRIELCPVDLNAIVEECISLVRADIWGRDVRIEVEPLPHVRGESPLIASLYTNLLMNALKYGPREGTMIRVGRGPAGDEPELFVESNSPTIPIDEREQIFEPYQRGTHERRARGAGLGLTICRGIVRRHGGRIWVRPAESEGNRFCFTLGKALG
jgi:light-regulated signal transduction histidine kinase (bacteriophytochrome)